MMTTRDVSLASCFAERAARTMSRQAQTFEAHTSSDAELWQRKKRFAAGLPAGGINAGDRVGFLGLNQPAVVEMLLAAGRHGGSFARYKLPTRLPIVDVLPRNPDGNVPEFELRERFAEVAP
jgi:acyl-CoA synthetase (AMP-forming)/AMP-acid ligase II